jgi:hypothetical protein
MNSPNFGLPMLHATPQTLPYLPITFKLLACLWLGCQELQARAEHTFNDEPWKPIPPSPHPIILRAAQERHRYFAVVPLTEKGM